LIFLTSLWFAFSRKTMPDTFAVSLVIIGIYCVQRFVDERNMWKLLLGGILLTLGGLCKIPAVFLFALFIPFALNKAIFYKLKIQVGITLVIASSIIAWWYFYWVPYLVETYRFQLFFPKGILEGINEIQPYWSDFWMQLYFGALRSYIVWIALLSGIAWLFYKQNKRAAIGFGILTLVFLLFAIKTGTVFPTHNYYVLPFSPVLAALAGIGLQRFQPKLSLVLLLIIAIEGIGNQFTDFRIKSEVRYRLDLAQQVNQFVPKGEKIIIATGSNPEWMYWYHRKGWSIEPNQFSDSTYMQQIALHKGKYIVIDKHDSFDVAGFEKVGETKDIKIYRFSDQ
jgi:4-amino-4-deoxy-L-arabinose transferase-like glycosyltransferase